MKEIKRNESVFWSASAVEDEEGKLHIYNPALEEAKENSSTE